MEFVIEVDKLKKITRQNYLADGSRKENDAEHSWHLALMALVLCEHVGAEESPDLLRVIKMALIHDLVEIDAGDTYCYDEKANAGKRERELAAADRLFGILPPDQAREFRELWEEFEEQRTPEARFAAALDRLQPLTLNYIAGGKSWREHGISYSQVIKRNSSIGESSPALWKFTLNIIREAVRKGYIKENG
ncbi:MAG TPA: HD domain-containing protein [Bacillota bacterium]|jgi:putative hydrolase of HD superfamily|nr:HD domain-containing protein [Bacillota bacterium]HOA35606.1 HD domain-containing protein [Bacillota bacterium]HPZ11439.1 HD domain-containing protein [Bacillota bacterium]HQE10505.1 HD domain-containing protein [Bacillota bacterium]